MTAQPPARIGRLERVLAFMFVAVIVMTVLAFIAILLGPVFGVTTYGGGFWAFVFAIPLVALPIAILMMIAMLVVGVRRRRRS